MRVNQFLILLNDPDAAYLASMLAYTPLAFYDASVSNVWEDSAATAPAGDDGDVVGRWDDLSGNGYHVSQATAANKPLLKLNIQNGRRVIRADGTDDFLQNTAFADVANNYTVFAVAKYNTSVDTSQGVFDVSTGAVNTGFAMLHDATTIWRGGSGAESVAGSDSRDGVWRLHTGHASGSQLQYWVNGASVGTLAQSANTNVLNTITVFQLVATPSYVMLGDIAALVIFNSTLSDANRNAVEKLLNERWRVY